MQLKPAVAATAEEKGSALLKRLSAWLVIFPCLIIFSVVLVGSAIAGNPSVRDAAAKVSAGHHDGVVIVSNEQSILGGAKKGVCWVSNADAAVIRSGFRTSDETLDGIRTLVVYDVSQGKLRQVMDGREHCTYVHDRLTYFLPFDPHTS